MSDLVVTIPAGRETDIGIFSFGPMPNTDTTFTSTASSSIGGFIFTGDTNLTSVSLANLTQIDPTNAQGGGLSIQNCAACATLSAPLLSYVGGTVILGPSNPNLVQAMTSISLPSLLTIAATGTSLALSFGSTSLTSFSAPQLTTLGGNLQFSTGAALSTLSFPALSVVGGFLTPGQIIAGTTFLSTALSAPALADVWGDILLTDCPNLTTLTLPSLVPHAGKTIRFSGCKLNAASVNLILARCVANASFTSGTVLLNGGTNAAPTGQGITDKATLIGRGVSVTTN